MAKGLGRRESGGLSEPLWHVRVPFCKRRLATCELGARADAAHEGGCEEQRAESHATDGDPTRRRLVVAQMGIYYFPTRRCPIECIVA